MRGLTLFRPLVSSYRKVPGSIGQIRHYGGRPGGMGTGDGDGHVGDLLLFAGIGAVGLVFAANYIYRAIEDSFNNESQKAISNGTNINGISKDEKMIALMLAVKNLQKQHPEYSIKLEDRAVDNKKEESNGFQIK